MAPGSSNKRKRSDRQLSQDDAPGRPSPHRPENMSLAQQNQQGGSRGGRGGGRRTSRQHAPSSPAVDVRTLPPPTPTPVQGSSEARETPAVESSKPSTPVQSRSSAPPATEEEDSNRAPYLYELITDDKVENWRDGGRQSIEEQVKAADVIEINTTLQELVRSALDRRIDASEAGAVVRQMIADHQNAMEVDVQSYFLSTISLLDDSDVKKSELLALVAATEIDPDAIRQELDIPLLSSLTLVRSSFTQMRTRKTTNLLYRQANFNLLREETEGYAKLITEYFNTANGAVHNQDVSAEAAFQRIKALVGSFDLDVGRVLDITLDISANLLVRAYGFFVKFYRCSSWWPEGGVLDGVKWEDPGFGSFPRWALPESERPKLEHSDEEIRKMEEKRETDDLKQERDSHFWQHVREAGMDAFFTLGSRRIVNLHEILPTLETEVQPEYDTRQKEINPDRRKRINENRKFMRETGTLPPLGNSDAAQLLGFKLRFYASDARDPQDTLPENLIYLVALLIKIGFISLRDLYPHLHPSDEEMPGEKSRLEKEKAEKEAKERPGGGLNALSMAGALTDDTLAPGVRALRGDKGTSGGSTPKPEKKDEEVKEELPRPSNQKIMLLKALLLIGALPEALYILGRFPWLMEVDTSLPPYLHRIARQMLGKVAQDLRPLGDRDDTQRPKDELRSTLIPADGKLLFSARDSKKVTRWLGLDQVDKTDGQQYRHYYPDWDDNIPICQNIEDVFLLCNTFLGLLGVKIGQDPAVYSTLLRVANHSLTNDTSQANRDRWLELMRRLLVPALSLSKHNVGLTDSVYQLLKFFPTTTRFNIYAEWYLGRTSRLPDMRVALDYNRAEVREVLRRVTNETGKKQARALAKVSLSSPGVVTMSMITQLESYSNMIPSLVECTRYFSPLGYDVLTWYLINSLSGQGKDRMQADGMLTSPWLQYLSQFAASLFLKYEFVNLVPVLQYLAHQLREKDSTDLEVFEQILTEMAGIRSDIEFNDAQVVLMTGREYFQSKVLLQLGDKRFERKASAQRLISALSTPGLIGQILISIAQERQNYAYHDGSKFMPLKVLGNNLDKMQSVYAQYLQVLKTNMKPEDFEAAVPDVISLIGDFGLEPAMAFTICRTAIASRVSEYQEKAEKQEIEDKKRRLSQEKPESQGDAKMEDAESKPQTNGDHVQSTETPSQQEASPAGNADDVKSASWHPILLPIIEALPQSSPRLTDRVSIPFFVKFWTLTVQEISPPSTQTYSAEQAKIIDQIKRLQTQRPSTTTAGKKEQEQKIEELKRVRDKITTENQLCVALKVKTRNRMTAMEKHSWFPHITSKSEIEARQIGLLEECFLPRAILSSIDAHFSFHMLRLVHDMGTPGFSTMHFIAQLMKKRQLAALMFQCTAMEAQHFGRFLCELLQLLQEWHADKAAYDKFALGANKTLPGFAKKLDADGHPESHLEFEDFRRLLYNWHSFLAGALQMCFESEEYMHIRNGIIVLKSIVSVFPALNFHGQKLFKHVTTISEDDPRQDLKLAAMSLRGPLKNREKKWMMPQAFRLSDSAKEAPKAGSRGPSARPETPQPGSGTPKLNAAAPDFKPSSSSGLTNGTGRKESVLGVEDGEINDEKLAASKDADSVMKDALVEQVAGEEQVKVEQTPEPTTKAEESTTAKPATPAPLPSKPPEINRSSSSRPASALPNRPDARPSRLSAAPPGDRGSGRFPRNVEERYGRLDRPGDDRPDSRGHSPSRSRMRTPERDPYYDSPAPARGLRRDDRALPRASPADSRHPHDDGRMPPRRDQPSQPPLGSRSSYDSRDRLNGAMAPPSGHSVHPDRAGALNSVASVVSAPSPRATPSQETQGQSAHHENPARLALINDDHSHTRGHAKDSRPGGRPGDDRSTADFRTNGGRAAAAEPARGDQSRIAPPTELAPTGPRRGRLSRDLSAQGGQESSYGRLNGAQDMSSGPRPMPNGPSGRGARNTGTPQGPAGIRPLEPPSSSHSNTRTTEPVTAPRGPGGRRGSGSHFEQPPPHSNSLPSTPINENGPAIHPSRRAQLEGQPQPAPIQTNVPAGRSSRSAASPTTAPPSGPRGSNNRAPLGAPAGPSPTTAAPPVGPASAAERQRRGDKQRAEINATLQGTGNGPVPQNLGGVNFRGAAQNRPPNPATSSVASAPPVQAIASSMEPPARRAEALDPPSRPASRQEPPPPSRGYNERHDERPSRQYNEGQGDRQRGSRHPSRERRAYDEPMRGPPPPGMDDRSVRSTMHDERRPRDDRDLRGGPPPRDSRPTRSDDRRPPGVTNNFGNGPPPDWSRGPERRGPPRETAMEESRRSGRGSTRPEEYRGNRREDEQRGPAHGPGPSASRDLDGPPPPSGARKRRHEDGPAFDESKRRRSGR